jgi:uncharacterized membrane protein YphA (DoxX/SURF4 family)
MMRIPSFSYALFAATLIGIGAWGLISGALGAIWQPIPSGVPMHAALAYLCAVVALAAGAGLLLQRTAAPAARLLLGYLLLWFLLSKAPALAHTPRDAAAWESAGESVVIIAAALAVYAGAADAWDRRRLGFLADDRGIAVARALYGLALIAFGVAHLAYVKLTASLIPAWLPAHPAWVYLTAVTYIAAGLAVLTGVLARPAAFLAALQMGLFTLLVWAPPIVHGSKDPSVWSEAVISWTLTIAGWLVAESLGGKAGSVSAPAIRGASGRSRRRR